MRIRRLDLLRYGRFTDVRLELPERSPDLTLVFGPNEAGKSTALAAIEDLLFGIPHSSPLNFLHDYSSMRVGAVLEHEGSRVELRRRKGSKDTLLTPEEAPLPAGDSALEPLLGDADRGFFERMFSLDQARLTRGGKDILEAHDDIGQMLFAAGAGLAGLRERLRAMEEEADGLWAPRRAARRKLYQCEDRVAAAEEALRAHTLTAAKWQELKEAHDAAEEVYSALERDLERTSAALLKLGRIRRVYRSVRALEELDRELCALAGVRPLPGDALATLQRAERDDDVAAARLATLNEELETARAEEAAATYDPKLLAREADIERLHERRIAVRDGRAELPQRRAELAAVEAELERLAAELDWSFAGIAALAARIPSRGAVGTVRGLANRRGALESASENTRTAADEADRRVAELDAELRALAPAADLTKLAAVLGATREAGDLGARISAAAGTFDDAEAEVRRRMAALRPAPPDETALVRGRAPAKETVRAHAESRRELDRRRQECCERRRAAAAGLGRARAEQERLVHETETATGEAVARAREHRDAGWSLIRRSLGPSRAAPSDAELGAFAGPERDLSAAYEHAVRAADELADRRFSNAVAAARLETLARGIAEQQARLSALGAEEQALDDESRRLDTAWTTLWSQTGVAPASPEAMLEWLEAREDALVAMERREAASRRLEALHREEGQARALVLETLAGAGFDDAAIAEQPLRVVLEAAAALEREHEHRAERRRALEESRRKAAADAGLRRDNLREADAAWTRWQAEWRSALDAIALDPAAAPDTVAVQLDAIEDMRTAAANAERLQLEFIGRIERDASALECDVARVVAAVAPDLCGYSPEDAVLELERRLAETRRGRDLHKEKTAAIASLHERIGACETSRREARRRVAELHTAAGTRDSRELAAAIADSDRLRSLKAERARLLGTLAQEGDGLSIPELEQECADADLDAVTARETSLLGAREDLRERQLEARERRTAARQAFEAVGGHDAAARAAAERQTALAEMRDAAERYTRVRSAAILLHWAIERYRREKQASLLERAGTLFATLTDGSFDALRVDFDAADRLQLVGVRPDCVAVPVPGMSTGTADQLYLALRIAALSDYLDRAPALPFVVDDLFINFDDARAAAGFRVLGELGVKTQVLFFTHHRHLLEVASAALGGSVSVVELGED